MLIHEDLLFPAGRSRNRVDPAALPGRARGYAALRASAPAAGAFPLRLASGHGRMSLPRFFAHEDRVLGGGGSIGSASPIVCSRRPWSEDLRSAPRRALSGVREIGAVEWVRATCRAPTILLGDQRMDAVLHLVSRPCKTRNEDAIFDVQSNLVATLQLLDAMVGPQVRGWFSISLRGGVRGTK